MALGRKAASVVSARFPAEMELKFEAICRPFLLLHVNRFAAIPKRGARLTTCTSGNKGKLWL